MSRNSLDSKASPKKAEGNEIASCSFEGKLVSIGGSRLVVEPEKDRKTSYALAADAILTCDGKVGKEESLKPGRRIRVTTQKGNSNMVTGVEWLSKNESFPAEK